MNEPKQRPARRAMPLFLFILLFGCTCLLSACTKDDKETSGNGANLRNPILEDVDQTQATVYYTTVDGQFLLPLTFDIPATREVAQVALEKLLAGPPNDFAASVIPAGTKLIELYSSDQTVYANLTEPFRELEAAEAPLAIRSIAATILPLVEGYNLKILVEGQQLEALGEYALPEEIVWSAPNILDPETEGVALTVYFADAQAMYLIPQSYIIPSDEVPDSNFTDILAERAVNLLLAGPDEASGLSATIWPGTVLNDIMVKDGIAALNFSPEIMGYGGGHAAESMLVGSLLYTITGIPGIHAVQILIDGQKIETLPEGTEISQPLKPDSPINFVII
jgi:germination protein M